MRGILMTTAAVAAAIGLAVAGEPEYGTLTDTRDGQTYRTVKMPDGKTWMVQNLNYKTDSSWCYENSADNCNKYGRLYAWNAAMTACPSGYYLPSHVEWDSLARSAGGRRPNTGEHFWFNVGNRLGRLSGQKNIGTDDYGFSSLPSGFRDTDGRFISAVNNTSNWWTATETQSGKSVHIWGFDYFGDTFEFSLHKSSGFPVLCVADTP